MDDSTATYSEPSGFTELAYAVRRIPSRIREWLIRMLIGAAVRLVGDTNSVSHAKRELRASLEGKEDGPNKWIAQNLIELIAIFSTQGHSGSSAPWCIDMFKKLAAFEPLGPLTGEDHEWMEVGEGAFQNMRCSHVFKQADRFDGQAYDINGRIFREPSGACYTSGKSHVPVVFPYTPTSEYVDVPADSAD